MIDEAGRLAREMQVSGVVFRRADLYALPFDDGAFSLVVCRNGLHRLPEPVAALKEAARVLSPGGRMVVFETQVSEVVDRPLNELARLREPAHRRYYRLDEYRELFEKAGLRVDEEREDRRTVDLDYWLEAAGASHEHREHRAVTSAGATRQGAGGDGPGLRRPARVVLLRRGRLPPVALAAAGERPPVLAEEVAQLLDQLRLGQGAHDPLDDGAASRRPAAWGCSSPRSPERRWDSRRR